ncbi:hypothetical protein AZE42_11997 [Rhizopogon vesiculosus]|uniref:Uncharacterized protein n=1 Tax=Rhizopogon vesiculosus TaxID=180088 RepID=A0A1J8PVD0_9AGAM|nr:hypothetical protein AZE42_11997 [Rhizopogon vesiculosus]
MTYDTSLLPTFTTQVLSINSLFGNHFGNIDAKDLRVWKVANFDIEKIERITCEDDIEGNEMLNPFASLFSEFPDEQQPGRVQIVVAPHPSESLRALKPLYDVLWNQPAALLSQWSIEYIVGDNEAKCKMEACTRNVIDLRNFADALTSLGFPVGSQLLISHEDGEACLSLNSQAPASKSSFLLYVLVKRMQAALPVAIQTKSDGYFLTNGTGVSFHNIDDSDPLDAHEGIWCLSDSDHDTKTPAHAFCWSLRAWIIQTAPPQSYNFRRWMDKYGGQKYVMGGWEEEEFALLGHMQVGQVELFQAPAATNYQ